MARWTWCWRDGTTWGCFACIIVDRAYVGGHGIMGEEKCIGLGDVLLRGGVSNWVGDLGADHNID